MSALNTPAPLITAAREEIPGRALRFPLPSDPPCLQGHAGLEPTLLISTDQHSPPRPVHIHMMLNTSARCSPRGRAEPVTLGTTPQRKTLAFWGRWGPEIGEQGAGGVVGGAAPSTGIWSTMDFLAPNFQSKFDSSHLAFKLLPRRHMGPRCGRQRQALPASHTPAEEPRPGLLLLERQLY